MNVPETIGPGSADPEIGVILLAYGDEPYMDQAVAAVLASTGITVELVIVDNGCTSRAVTELPVDPRIRIVTPDHNLGFAGGVNVGAAYTTAPLLALVNSDAIVEGDCLHLLAEHVRDARVGIAGATILLAEPPAGAGDTVNSAGNPLHVLGLSWAGDMNRPASELPAVKDVASASGACLVMRRQLWDSLGGFPAEFFAYMEDMELSWRCWQHGLRVQVLAAARARHYYEFSRSPLKMYLVERNRWLLLLTCHQRRTLALVALPLIAFEVAIAVVAQLQGWGKQKRSGWTWIWQHRGWIRRRRSVVQSSRTVPDGGLSWLITDRFDPAQTPLPQAAAPLEWLLRGYWGLVRPFLPRRLNG